MTTSVRIALLALAFAMVMVGALTGSDEAEAIDGEQTLRIPAASFAPTSHAAAYSNTGRVLINLGSSSQEFRAPVLLEGDPSTIHSVKLHYLDNGSDRVCTSVRRYNMKTGIEKQMSYLCSKNAIPGPRTRTDATIWPDVVTGDHGVFIRVNLPPGSQYGLTGVTIIYTPDLAAG